ncbi:hypothetical protein [Desulfonatronovibrio magnus]|uniref:hypothetical protein n=1 Tax=Desulfonatronovibrio magnus TaxID=698827 RepID=UPI0005EBE20D|nr:hypothetical protein [Desulfonatronovibrio magnus]
MKCHLCGEKLISQTGTLQLPSKILSDITLNNVLFFKCEHCEEVVLPSETWKIADNEEKKQIEDCLKNLPVKDFIGASKASSILEISRQALHKHRRIRRGFIYSILHEDKILYHEKSVRLYKQKGDGRFPLSPRKSFFKKPIKYFSPSVSNKISIDFFNSYSSHDITSQWGIIKNKSTKSLGYTYVQ